MNKREKQEYRRILRENARLRRENEYLNHRIESLSPREAKNATPERELFYGKDNVDSHKSYLGYLASRFRLSSIYRIYDKVFFTLRKIILASKIWSYAPAVLGALAAFLQGALAFGSLLVLLPAALAASAIFLAVSLSAFAKQRQKLLKTACGKKIYFVYPAKIPRKDGAFYETMRLLARGGIVFAVTPSLRLCGLGAVKKADENVYFIHTSFYYGFKEEACGVCSDVVKVY